MRRTLEVNSPRGPGEDNKHVYPIAVARPVVTKSDKLPFLGGALLFLCALAFYYFAVLRVDYAKTTLLNLAPHPDATEYFAQAKALRREGWPSIQIGYDKLPSRYPFGYPVLMLPWLKILRGTNAVLAPFRTNQTTGVLLLLTLFGFYTYLAMPLTGGFAALLLATLPCFFTFCRSSMSEISASLFIVLAFMFCYLGLKEERRWKIYLSAVLLGLSLNIRIQSLFFAPLLLAMALVPVRGRRLRWFLHCAAVPVAFLMAASPVLVLNTIQFQSPFKTGYNFWAPRLFEDHDLFSFRNVPANAMALWRELILAPIGYHTPNIFGTGTCFVPAFVLLICLGLSFIRIDRFVICAFLAGLAFLVGTLTHHYLLVDPRYYLPLLMLLIAVAVLPLDWAARKLFAGRQIIAGVGIFALFAAACLGYPSRSGYDTSGINRSQAWDACHFTDQPNSSIQFDAQGRFARLLKRQPGVVLSDIDPVYLNALLPRSFVAAPIDGNHHYKWSYKWLYDRPQALALVKHSLQRSLPVYALFISRAELSKEQARLPQVPGYEWRIIKKSHGNLAILKLTAIGLDQASPTS